MHLLPLQPGNRPQERDCGAGETMAHGGRDVLMPPINAFAVQHGLPNAQLVVLYPDANHGP
ncbi:hypothetical protein G9X64_04545 [Rhizobium sophorae]|uniref:Uncharacterized protein n=1 Tax=Rhizobium sophorae TaxID=1535242 RepID=A0A7Y3S2D8_9HYPH|nr:hypothetical protein [Rhizobium sophorae]NKL39014.1 hypothetical protein [Rhizobium leguminosarum bv. viciae]NNU35766.1 hypothetical protein [Rhizobium sophorae]